MGTIVMPICKWPTQLDDVGRRYLKGDIDANELEDAIWQLLLTGKADEPADYPEMGMPLAREWR